MDSSIVTSQYLQIAKDLATRIAKGEFPEGSRLFGRSKLASEYAVSPETIRRALHLLEDMKVVEIKPQSGATVRSADSARRYIANLDQTTDPRSLKKQFMELLEQYDQLHHQMLQFTRSLIKSRAYADEGPLPNYAITIPKDSPVIGKSLGELKYWQRTGGTVVAIRRGPSTILSPGPHAELYDGDVIILVGPPSAMEASKNFLSAKKEVL